MGRGNKQHPFAGSITALPTPIRNGQLDEATLRADIEFHVTGGSQGLVLTGSTGESASMSLAERRQIWSLGVDQVDGRIPILAGVGAPSTQASLEMAQVAVQVGVQGLLAVTPYYTVPDARGQVAHFEALAKAQPHTPILLYNVPTRTGCDMAPATAHALANSVENIVGIKEASRSLARIDALCGNPNLDVFAGDDLAMVDFLRRGAVGAITVIGNLMPREVAELVGLAAINPSDRRVEQLETSLAPLMACLTLGPNPTPLKAALELQRGYPGELRLPLMPAESGLRDRLRVALTALGCLDVEASLQH
ncbi:MAG: 4-hydroxy-tetrahydrodipicolinate synthase [Planctomycetes bacterium]|nr:4-hydroxy-tetrahydrodipicolinate synthase [Planctomycetota bacterium]MCB9911279.1 4-hydroxy-tetrahydrodipicolinate synthase [Planctomycetota bacterium]MCB9911542.1 4-hydroxy-tetrahydrodipicolinate synthase [Planctomycetota bacterium]HPF13445.1 4-hydroxy-tetrahydrodipicolinate synthase [Planctomycetota bacterium]HRV81256.1 4-hydroxy-tetrahydrodipicolinate synthase [Planctomycetota bacterium]